MATVMCVFAADVADGDTEAEEEAGADVAGAVVLLDELLVTEQPPSATATTTTGIAVSVRHLRIRVNVDISSSLGRD